MNGYKVKKILTRLLGSLMLAGILAVAADIAIAWQGKDVPCSAFLAGAALGTVLFFLHFRKKPGAAVKTALGLLTAVCVTAAVLFAGWWMFSEKASFRSLDSGKKQLYADRKVMLIVPHQDDDINVLGGVMEEYVRYGSELYPVFVTNGDYEDLAEVRFREVLDVMDYIGVPRENVIFLGYGDDWAESGPHLYNAGPGQVMQSYNGRTETYSTQAKAVYREGREYTRENLLEDLEDLILEYRPEVIFCSDYDRHIDHKAVSLAFEKVMGRLLKTNPDYRPKVFKGYAYNTAWYAQADFYALNILSTQDPFGEPFNQTPQVYRWEDRVRLPVWDGALSRSLRTSRIFETLKLYGSQDAHFQAARVINGDKVVWYRDTNSLCLNADVSVSSGDGSVLTDFMIAENSDLRDEERLPCDGTWIPEDPEKTAVFSLPQTVSLRQITLYDNPSPDDNVLGGSIFLDDGTEVPFGPLEPEGAATVIKLKKSQVTSFRVVLKETEGDRAGLAEVEAFGKAPDHGFTYVKLTDSEGNFVYDWTVKDSEDFLNVYAQGLTEEETGKLTLSWDNLKCWAGFEDGRIRVLCPEGKTVTLTVKLEGTDISDTVRISNPGELTRLYWKVCQTLEEQVFQKYCDGAHRNSATYKLLVTALDLLR